MHLKTLTLRGFKSFASATTLRFEPGITCVVGPNGSGKSNVVDALAWVMGEQGVKTLRGGKMEDVIFAGTTGTGGRPPLGRAEVSLTIDNADGALPIGYAEVTLTRTMFRSGGSEYAINGAPARLLDVQELLSDSGIGREMHVIVGQGQLDAVLHATPEDRRGFVEEAAGVLKHRKRKERALRKLESMQANLTRLSDLTAEVRRQLGPLARQADVARRAAVVAAEVRDARSRLLADDLVQATAALAADLADTQARADRRRAAAEELDAARGELAGAQEWAAQVAPRLVAAREAYYALQGVRERLRSTAAVAAERERHLRPLAHAPADSGRDVEALVADAVRAREDEGALADQVRAEGEALAVASGERTAAEAALAVHERALAAQARERADATERLAALGGQVSARRSRAEAARAEAERTLAAREAARERAEAAARRVAELTGSPAPHAATPFEGQSRATPAGEGRGSAASHDDSRANGGKGGGEEATEGQDAGEALADAEADLARWRAAEREAESDRAGAQARAEALEMALRERRDGTGALLDHGGHLPGVLGSFASLLQVRPGAQDVVAAALGAAAEAVAVESVADAVDALRLLRERTAGRAELVSASTVEPVPDGGRRARGRHGAAAAAVTGTGAGGVGAGQVDGEQAELAAFADHLSSLPGVGRARPLLSLVSAPPQLSAALARLLSDHVAVDGLAQARALVAVRPDLVAVTRGGDVLGAHGARGGSPGAAGGPPSRLHVQAALEQARSASAEAAGRAEHAREELARASASVASAREAVAAALAELQARDAAAAAAARVLGEATGTARAAAAEDQRLSVAARRASEAAEAETARHVEAVERLRAAEAEVAELLGLRAVGAPGGAPGDPGDPGDPGNAGAAGDLGDPGAADPQATSAALAAAAAAARAREVDARLALRTAEERLRGLAGRAEGLERRARAEQARVEASLARARRAATQLAAVVAVRTGADVALAVARQALLSAGLQRDDAEADAASSTDHLVAVRQRAEALAVTVEGLTDSVHRDELARAERSAHADALRERALQELGVDAEVLVEEFGPDRQVPVLEGTGTGGPQTVPYVRAEQEERLRRTERALAKLGTVNPLALEEFAALEERSAFLSRQLDDLRTARGDLMGIVAEVDERVQEVFAAAFADTAAEFEKIFARLFPGGEGALVLTDPDDLLTSGIDVEARPAGKRVKRLSLLSGGERSLTAVAILVAIFKARPSPFYVLDEVEAALDDTNLRRLLVVLEELRDASQLVVITHQERTMEVADALYGVSMRADGISAVVSQRLRSPEGEQPAAASGGATVDLREGAKADAPTG